LSVYEFEDKRPVIGKGTFIFKSADVIGDVKIGKNCLIGPGARVKGDYGTVNIGDNTAIEENVIIHARPDDITTIGNNVTIGHGSIIHNATIRDWAIVGMGAIVSDWAVVGRWAVVAEGAVVKNKQKIPDRAIAVGLPATVISEISRDYEKTWTKYKKIYIDLARKRYPCSLREIDEEDDHE